MTLISSSNEKSPQAGFLKWILLIFIICGAEFPLRLLLAKIYDGLGYLVSGFDGFRICLEVTLGNNQIDQFRR